MRKQVWKSYWNRKYFYHFFSDFFAHVSHNEWSLNSHPGSPDAHYLREPLSEFFCGRKKEISLILPFLPPSLSFLSLFNIFCVPEGNVLGSGYWDEKVSVPPPEARTARAKKSWMPVSGFACWHFSRQSRGMRCVCLCASARLPLWLARSLFLAQSRCTSACVF